MLRKLALPALASALVFGAAGNAAAAPSTPENCTFAQGVTTCTYVGDPVVTTSTTYDSADCALNYETTTVTTTYTARRGPAQGKGPAVAAPPSTSTSSDPVFVSKVCPRTTAEKCQDAGGSFTGPGYDSAFGRTTFFTCSGFGENLSAAQAAGEALVMDCRRNWGVTTWGQTTVYYAQPGGWYVTCMKI